MGRGFFSRAFLPGRLQRTQPAVEDAGHPQRLVRRDLARRHRGDGRIGCRERVNRRAALRQVKLDRPVARPRHQTVDEETRDDSIAGQRLVDEDARDPRRLAVRQCIAQQGRPVMGAGLLAGRIAGLPGHETAIGIPRGYRHRFAHDGTSRA